MNKYIKIITTDSLGSKTDFINLNNIDSFSFNENYCVINTKALMQFTISKKFSKIYYDSKLLTWVDLPKYICSKG